jgi:hypothetical protein
MSIASFSRRVLRPIWQAWDVEKGEGPSIAERDAAVAALNPKIETDNPSTARFVLAEIKESVEKKRAAQRTIEGKATGVIGFASAALAFAIALRGGALLMTWWVLPGLIALFAAIIFGVAVLFLHQGAVPNALLYNLSDVVNDVTNEARIASALAENWAQYERTLDASGAVRAARLDLAFAAYIFGLLWIVALSAASVVRH